MSVGSTSEVDVVLPVRSASGKHYAKLMATCQAIRAHIPVHHLITVSADTSDYSVRTLTSLSDVPVIDSGAVGVGRARRIGLQHVDTEYYASIDADVVISANWYRWCSNILRNPKVAACQGWAKPTARIFSKWATPPNPALYATLGDTMLRTEAIRKVGISDEPKDEDVLLRKELNEAGYLWVVNPAVISAHLLSDEDVLQHCYWWGKYEAHDWVYLSKYVLWYFRWSFLNAGDLGVERTLYTLLEHLSLAAGSFVGYYSSIYGPLQSSNPTLFSP